MHLQATISQIESVVQWLQGTDETQWQDQFDLIQESTSELGRMSGPLPGQSKTGTRSVQRPVYAPGSEGMRAAIPHLQDMLVRIRSRDRAGAIESGLAALASLR
jgi:hypothetical protein